VTTKKSLPAREGKCRFTQRGGRSTSGGHDGKEGGGGGRLENVPPEASNGRKEKT